MNPIRVYTEPVAKRTGTFVALDFDAEVTVDGRTWLRVMGGFGAKYDREDWVLDVPGYSVSVSKWNRDEGWDWNRFATREEAMHAKVRLARRSITYKLLELAQEQCDLARAVHVLAEREGQEQISAPEDPAHVQQVIDHLAHLDEEQVATIRAALNSWADAHGPVPVNQQRSHT